MGGHRAGISEFVVFLVLSWLNLVVFLDRGIIPGSSVEFNKFISSSTEYQQADILLGLLQSSFIVGLVAGSLVFGHLTNYYERFRLIGVGIAIWVAAVIFSGLSYYFQSYGTLLFARVMSGFGEACLLCNVPPWIQSSAPDGKRGTWLGVFYTTIPVGIALGYAYSAAMSVALGWPFAFFIEGICSLPFVFVVFAIEDNASNTEKNNLLSVESQKREVAQSFERKKSVTIWDELWEVSSSPVYLCLALATAGTTLHSSSTNCFSPYPLK